MKTLVFSSGTSTSYSHRRPHPSALLGGRKVDLVNPKYLNRRLRDRVLAEAEVLYFAIGCRLRVVQGFFC
ncbi:MAG: hypothetical protein HY912_16770 [Desulfomonile tiedjei]|uniref:Uncharacterized protein n=1 Tax=Desulfomonile tiedjei TaxID=2358 RepID=A0A9D6Z4M1_9BACT|nr:hypothetical protein [Desulfomonile tiedjei]